MHYRPGVPSKRKAANTLINAAKTREIPLAASPALALAKVTCAARPETRPGASVHRTAT